MTYITKPKFHHPALPTNALGFTHRDFFEVENQAEVEKPVEVKF